MPVGVAQINVLVLFDEALRDSVSVIHVIVEPDVATLKLGIELLLCTVVVATTEHPVDAFNTVTE